MGFGHGQLGADDRYTEFVGYRREVFVVICSSAPNLPMTASLVRTRSDPYETDLGRR
jgi:hypothetical protein